ncbi:MAG: hypothetical protein DCC65_00245 [Planctomycetota bacterium]|nr:MAG: hypothetical protein DCC65_00245 [Planctomycetota bacterium]
MGLFSRNDREEMYACPVCDRAVRFSKTYKLFGTLVCRKCRNAFVNRRQLAYIIDVIVFWVATMLVESMIAYLFIDVEPVSDFPSIPEIIFWLVIYWVIAPLIFGLKDGFRGRSPGKWLTGVQVVDRDSREPIGFAQSFKRNLVLVIPLAPLVVAVQLIAGYRLGDKWANTCVIWKKYRHRMPFDPRGVSCTACGYDLTGNVSGRCPECGKEIPAFQDARPIPVSAMS